MMNEIDLTEWLRSNNCEANEEAEQIYIGQALTDATAMQIKRILKRTYLDREDLNI